MKKPFTYNSSLLSLISAVVTVVFIILAVGSIPLAYQEVEFETTYDEATGLFTQKKYLFEVDEEEDEYIYRLAETTVGKKDKYGAWIGPVKVTHIDYNKDEYIEYGLFEGGERNGYSERYLARRIGEIDTLGTDMYLNGRYVGKVEKSAQMKADELSAWQILSNEYPWYVHTINGRGYSNDELKALTDTIEALLALKEFDAWEFEDFYDDIIDELDFNSPFEEILASNSEVTSDIVIKNAKKDPFRMAVIDYYWSPGKTIYEIIINDYYSYYRSRFDRDGKREHFERFCSDIQDSLKNYPPVGISDPFLTDSVNSYLYTILYTIVMGDDDDDELSGNPNAELLKSASLSSFPEIRSKSDLPSVLKNMPAGKLSRYLRKSGSSIITKHASVSEYDINSFATSIVLDIYLRAYEKSDIIREAVEKAWCLKNGAASEPVVVTLQAKNLTDTSVEITGLVIWDGGDPVYLRGITWADFYEPTISDNKIEAGAGTGEFKVTISGLEKGKTYHARSYAYNDRGRVYGNDIKFTASLISGIDETAVNMNKFLVYPNPAKERATVSFSLGSQERVTLQITDLAGKEVLIKGNESFPQGAHQMNLDLTSLKNGIYICRLITGREVMEQKIIVSR